MKFECFKCKSSHFDARSLETPSPPQFFRKNSLRDCYSFLSFPPLFPPFLLFFSQRSFTILIFSRVNPFYHPFYHSFCHPFFRGGTGSFPSRKVRFHDGFRINSLSFGGKRALHFEKDSISLDKVWKFLVVDVRCRLWDSMRGISIPSGYGLRFTLNTLKFLT